MKETHSRSVSKAITYRIAATIALGIITWIYTKEFFTTSAITIVFTIVATALFYLNERAWNRIKWGKRRK
ncbi:MAG TPA: DUF2061 domain-containing protein [archaeon]|nr:DUF2061 domain-containing protein [archaeon]